MEEDGGVRVAEVSKGSNPEKLGAPRVGDVLLSVEYVPKGTDKEPVFEDLEPKVLRGGPRHSRSVPPQQRMIEVVVERESNGDDDVAEGGDAGGPDQARRV